MKSTIFLINFNKHLKHKYFVIFYLSSRFRACDFKMENLPLVPVQATECQGMSKGYY